MRLIDRLRKPLRLPSELSFVLGAPLLWLVLYNVRFWREAAHAMWHPSLSGIVFMGALFVLVLFVQFLLVAFLPRRLLQPLTAILFIIAALVSYFSDAYGVFMDKDMIRNAFATDTAEVAGLINGRLIGYLLILGVLPAVLILRLDIPQMSAGQRLKQRSAVLGGVFALAVAGLFAASASYASFFREHKPVRYLLNPASAVYGALNLAVGTVKASDTGPVRPIGEDAVRIVDANSGNKPLVLFLVVGETARAANFQLGGYERATNPELTAIDDLIYFRNTTSCGTATAVSLPCIFALEGREDFDVDDASHTQNLLDVLARAGLDVQWRDNNSGCKGVCARVKHIEYSAATHADLCRSSYCYDEDMLTDLTDLLAHVEHDTVIVFHPIGSHGPSYFERYPERFEKFRPACRTSQLSECTAEEVRNAYDNTILYADHILARQIETLRAAADRIDSMLLYISDHGESLGENGVYLHGMPYALAPAEQKEVPFLMWMSPGYERRTRVDAACLQSRADAAYSHDNIFHTVMGAMRVRSSIYDPQLDVLAACRQPPLLTASVTASPTP